MMKRLLAFLCVLALLCGMYVVPAAAETKSTEGGFHVGYAKEDINPWLTNSSVNGVPGVALPEGMTTSDAAYTDYTVSLSNVYVYRPNNNTYFRTGRTMIRVPMGGYANSTERLSNNIQDDNGDGFIGYGDGQFITCTTVTDVNGYTLFMFTSDTVSGYSNLRTDVAKGIAKAIPGVSTDQVTLTGSHSHGGPDFNSLRSAKIKGTNPLWAAYYDYVVDKMVNAAVSAYNGRQEATMSKGNIDASVSSGYQLNKIRQYLTKQYKFDWTSGTYKATGVEFISGAHLNTYSVTTGAVNGYTYQKTKIADADDTMYILQFEIEGQKPIIMVNWRAHATMTTANTNLGLSSDYINSFRYAMEKAGYQVAFFQGAGGNIIAETSPWATEHNISGDLEEAVYYGGTMLAGVALDCLSSGYMKVQTGNDIRSTHIDMPTELQEFSEGLIAAAKDYVENGHSGYHPKPYLHTDGKYYYVNSASHARSITSTNGANTLGINAFLLGDGVAIVTAPNEMYDRYSLEVDTLEKAMENKRENNDWYNLETDDYGMPFVFAYTNGHSGYMGDYLSYSYNEDFVYPDTYSNGTIDGKYGVGTGSYETNAARYARGTGEKMIVMYGQMLETLRNQRAYKSAMCQHCNKTVEWTPLTAAQAADSDTLEEGHYYLLANLSAEAANTKQIKGNVCLDLNGHTITVDGPAFKCTKANSTFSLMDSVGGGGVTSYANGWRYGGVVYVYNTATPQTTVFNLYGGTLQMITPAELATSKWVGKGGAVCIYGVMNMYGGTIKGGSVSVSAGSTTNNRGGSIYLYENSALNVYGGTIESGSVQDGGLGKCVFLQGRTSAVTLAGNAVVDEILVNVTNGDELVIAEDFAGSAKVAVNPEGISVTEDGVDIGTVNGTIPVTLDCADANYRLKKQNADLIISLARSEAAIIDANGKITRKDTVAEAIAAYNSTNRSYIQLLKNVENLDIGNQTVYMDLNGCNIGKVTASKGGMLYCMDSQTDDYVIEGNAQTGYTGFGRIGSFTKGTVAAVTEDMFCSRNQYLMITENSGISFHRVNLQITAVSLRVKQQKETACNPSLYFKSVFSGDQLVADNVESFGVALSVVGVPNAETMETTGDYSRFQDFKAGPGSNGVNSTLLYGILKEENPVAENATMPIYGRPYMLLKNGEVLFGVTACRTLREQVEMADDLWGNLTSGQQESLLAMYKTYQQIMETWSVDNIKTAYRGA